MNIAWIRKDLFCGLGVALSLAPLTWATEAQHVPVPENQSTQPQLDVDGVGIGTLGAGRASAQTNSTAGVDFSDSDLFVSAAQRLFRNGAVGSFGIGGLTTEQGNLGVGSTTFFLNQAYVDYQTQSFEALLGRTDNPTAHRVDFPTLRGDDLITLTNPLDPFSNGGNIEEHRYSNVAQVVFNQDLKYFENIHAQHLIDSVSPGATPAINSFGASFQYLGTPGMEAFSTFPSWGAGYEHLTPTSRASGGLHQIYAGGVLNLNHDVVDHWDLRAEDVLTLGSGVTAFQSISDTYQANFNQAAASIRYLDSPFGKPGYQLALTAGYATYFDVSHSSSVGWALTGAKRLGEGFDLVAEYLGQWRDSALAAAQANGVAYEQVAEVGFVFNYNAIFNRHLAPRRSILNQQHQYIPN